MTIYKKILATIFIIISIFLISFDGIGNHGHFMFRPHMTEDWLIWGLIFLTGFIGLRLFFTKEKEIIITNKDELIVTLTRIVELLRDNAFSPQADAVRKPLQYLYADDKENFLKYLKTADIWGGSGAAWEVAPFPTRQIELEFQTCFIRLVELMRQTGIKFSAADSIESAFKRGVNR